MIRWLPVLLILTVAGSGCETDSPTSPQEDPVPSHSVAIDSPEDCICINPGQSVNFASSVTGAFTSGMTYLWRFDATRTSTLEDPGQVTYDQKGVYFPSVEATRVGDTDRDEVKVIVRDNCEPLLATIETPEDNTSVFDGDPVVFSGGAAGGDAPYTYDWNFGDTGIPNFLDEDPGARVFTQGPRDYLVRFIVTDAVGDSDAAVVTVRVLPRLPALDPGPIALPFTNLDGISMVDVAGWAGNPGAFTLLISHSAGVSIYDPLNQVTFDSTFDNEGEARLGAVPLSAQTQNKAQIDALFRFGTASRVAHYENGEWSAFEQLIEPFGVVLDGSAFGGVLEAPGLVATTNARLLFVEFDSSQDLYQLSAEVTRATIDPALFFGLVSSFAEGDGSSYVVISGGSPGNLYHHDRSANPGTLVGQVGNDPRKVRCLDGICVVTNFESDSITVATWDDQDVVTLGAEIPVGDGPVGVDLLRLSNGNIGALTTGFNDGSVHLTEISPAGDLVGSNMVDLSLECVQPGHAVWSRDALQQVVVSCFGSDNLYVTSVLD